MAFTKGKNLRLKFNDKYLLHATDCGLSVSLDLEEIATKDTDGKEQLPGDYSYTLSTSAMVASLPNGDTTHVVSDVLIDAIMDKTKLTWEFTSGEVGTKIYSGEVYVTQGDITATNGSVAGTSFTLTGSGSITRETVV